MNRQHCYIDNHWDLTRNSIVCTPHLSARHSEVGCIDVTSPPQFPKGKWSPEHLLTAAVNGSFMMTFMRIAESTGQKLRSFACRATGVLEQADGKLVLKEIQLEAAIVVDHEKDYDRILEIIREAEENSLLSNSIKTKIAVHPWIEVLQLGSQENMLQLQ